MTREFLHFIQKNSNEAVEGAIEEVLCSYPSKYVSHTVDTFNVDSTLWHVTALELQNIPLVEGTNYIQMAREMEGISVLGSGPDMNDGNCRLVCTASIESQLSTELFDQPSFCSCCSDVEITRVSVELKEISSCKVPLKSGFGHQKDVRSQVLQDKTFEGLLDCSGFQETNGKLVYDLQKRFINCRLPELGPTFYSDSMSRTYELHFAVTVGCAAQECSTTLKASIEINIAIKDDINKIVSTKKPKQRTGDIFHVVSLPKSSSTMHDLKRIVEQRLGHVGVDFSAYHTYSCALNGAIFTLLVVNLSGKNKSALFKSDLKEKKDEVEENGSVMVYSNGAFTICSSGTTLQALRMLHLTPDNDSIPLGLDRIHNAESRALDHYADLL
ncbi:uncharacterized protein CXQ87_004404 [Candidozyma duobushaemuli]|uniref:Uncharacterized protein n=1 Tax=Candidozyma duobushaemuli TaxID=1231522 RepID=A0A2V1AFZ5_9ASCO|nr:uncharacterized protein CXQ87_004404 [[Candida] duobushaemulonis]PVH16848.1 hypothetical protein CXQ87_004404 [[Candida] duobushaemulonis]